MQIHTLSIQPLLCSSLVYWYRDATGVPFGHLFIDLSPRTDDRFRYWTNGGKTSSKFYVTESLKQLTALDDEHTSSLYFPRVPITFPQEQKATSPIVSNRVYSGSKRVIVNILHGNLQNVKRHHINKYKRELHLLSLKRTTWKQRRDLLTSERGLQLVDTITPFVINHLS